MLKNVLSKTIPLICLMMFTAASRSHGSEYGAYVYTYYSMVDAQGVAGAMEGDDVEGDLAEQISETVDEAFDHSVDAYLNGDDSQWAEALADLENARFWCNTLIVFAENSQPSSVIYEISSLMWVLDIAIEQTEGVVPPPPAPTPSPRPRGKKTKFKR